MSSSSPLARPARLVPAPPTPADLLSPSPFASARPDDFLALLDPTLVVDALASPSGALRPFLDGASPLDREFAMRTALASQSIARWLAELRAWHWPAEGGSRGFDTALPASRKLFVKVFAPDDDYKEHVGCLPAADVSKYETRIDAITADLAALDLEDIKGHVLAGHILPVSRSPSARLDDASALVAAIVLRTLPDLARLSRLLDTWSTRLTVLSSVNPLLRAVADAEMLLQDNWTALSKFSHNITAKITKRKTTAAATTTTTTSSSKHRFPFSRAAFEARRDALALKVAESARILDYMLDSLEGSPDTLPDDWLTRMEEVEKGFGEWIAACERCITETELAAEHGEGAASSPDRRRRHRHRHPHRSREAARTVATDPEAGAAIVEPTPRRPARFDRLGRGADALATDGELSDSSPWDSSPCRTPSPTTLIDDDDDAAAAANKPDNYRSRPLYRLDDDDFTDPFIRGRRPARDPLNPMSTLDEVTEDEDDDEEDDDSDDDSGDDRFDETQLTLPPSRNRDRSRDSLKSDASSLVRFDVDFDGDFSEDSASSSRKSRSRELAWNSADDDDDERSPGSSPFPSESRRRAAPGLLDSPLFEPIPEDDEDFRITMTDSFYEDDDGGNGNGNGDGNGKSPDSEETRSRPHRESVGDADLRQKISQIIQKISTPNRLRLSTDPPAITLNPPDFKPPVLPRKKAASASVSAREDREPAPMRSSSGMSTRTVTPSFTLSPVRFVRARDRHHHHHHAIKVYHLSRNNGEAPIKLFVRCVGENGERVMVRVGGGWADLGEYLKEYISHHGRRSSNRDKTNVEVRTLKRHASLGGGDDSSPPSRPTSGGGREKSPMTPLHVRKSRRRSAAAVATSSTASLTPGSASSAPPHQQQQQQQQEASPSEALGRARSGSHSWVEKESSVLGLAGPSGRKIEMSEEHKAWVESVKDQVRMTNGDAKTSTSGTKRASRKV